ncbi:HD domain-containing phosphohydrolase [Pleionea litopenaei]|uniref:Hpt domain-containing protein n=1 Tax=Pleionea litopenaei TaxID=3070815 RepID=A0AA51RW21_9GAMM|nr:HD domain-containing phosphohydrolase [Pleionea sp. HL-JVS1]WMS88698.1 Hpt domain-containing protein [Pleionea sp. HL-JVS1]
MNIESICQAFAELDGEVKQEFYSDVKDCVKDINDCLPLLSSEDPQVLINRMFRSIHTIKGNCNMVFLEPFVSTTHLIEELVQDIRSQNVEYAVAFGRLLIAGINAVDDSLAVLMDDGILESEKLQQIEALFAHVRQHEYPRQLEEALRAEQAINDRHFSLNLVAVSQFEGEAFSIFDATDMEFFHYLSECQHAVDELHETRMKVITHLSKAINQLLAEPEDDDQLLAAIYTYEFFAVVKGGDSDQTRRRVFSAGSLLARMPGWGRASELVFQSNEKVDGNGFPRRLRGEQVLDGAKILSLVDQFITLALESQEQGYKKSLFFAVKSINQLAEIEYSQSLINAFNQVIKRDYLSQLKW